MWQTLSILTKTKIELTPQTTVRTASIEEENAEEAIDVATATYLLQTQLDNMAIGSVLRWKAELMDRRPE